MTHLILLFICFLSVEIFVRSNYISLIKSLVEVSKKAININSNKKISDHWKENIIPKYSLQMMKSSEAGIELPRGLVSNQTQFT